VRVWLYLFAQQAKQPPSTAGWEYLMGETPTQCASHRLQDG